MIATIAAVLGTLLGALLSGLLAQRQADRTADRAADEVRHTAAVDAAAQLAEAIDAHRAAMWAREDARLAGRDWDGLRETSHQTRAAITAPLLRVQLLLPEIAETAERAATSTYALRGAADAETLADLRDQAKAAASLLVLAAAGQLA
ncbi:predicted protein [Streptomyces sp. SPB78]|uniref:hypothetical protein n=1 Tax=Streptomyces sp. (strain SPB78) TaxID=591157 RepID=UPI0001B54A1C|nr:hypothetical protein [Streptomyces sp. SPB78]EFL04298.1 predicted protein [Streptomyces sp. SPB78]